MISNALRGVVAGGRRRGAPPVTFSNVQLLLHFDGPNNSQVYTDSSMYGRTVSEIGASRLSTANFKYGTASLSCTADYIVSVADAAALQVGSAPFTVEFWAYLNNASGTISKQYEWEIEFLIVGVDRKVRVKMGSNGVSYSHQNTFPAGAGNAFEYDTWFHVALERVGDTVSLYIGGVSLGSFSFTGSVADTANELRIGKIPGESFIAPGSFIDDFRFVVGQAAYQGPFTPPTAAHPDS